MQTIAAKIYGLLSCLLFSHFGISQSHNGRGKLDSIGVRIVNQARRDVGTQEKTWRNDHPLFDYYRVLGGNANKASRQGWKDAYCAYGVYAWYLQAGVKPPVKMLGRALNWSKHSTKLPLGLAAKPDDIKKLGPGWVVGFHFDSYHIGIIEETYALYAITIEANTSLSNAVGTYKTKHQGVIRKRRFYKDAIWAVDYRGSPSTDSTIALKLRSKYLKPP